MPRLPRPQRSWSGRSGLRSCPDIRQLDFHLLKLRLFSVQNIIIKKPIPLCGVPLLGELCLHNAVERYDAQIAEATKELERQKRTAGQIEEQLDANAGAGAQERMADYLEKNSALYEQLRGVLGKTADASAVLDGLAGATGGKLSGAFQTAGDAVSKFGTALSGMVAKAAPFLAVATVIFGLLKKLWSAAQDFAVGFTNALKRGAAAVYSFGSAVGQALVDHGEHQGALDGAAQLLHCAAQRLCHAGEDVEPLCQPDDILGDTGDCLCERAG